MSNGLNDMKVIYDSKENEYYVKVKMGNQTLRLTFYLDDWNEDTVYFRICLSVYNKRSSQNYNENHLIMTGLDPLKTVVYGRKAFDLLEERILKDYNDSYRVVISCLWADNRRRDAYYSFMSRRGYKYGNLYNKKCIMQVWEKREQI